MEEDTLSGTSALLERWFAMSADQKEEMRVQARRTFEARFEIFESCG